VDLEILTRARAPLRLGLAGGGTDLSPYCDTFGGAVLNATIDRFAYAFISVRDDDRLVFRAHDLDREETLRCAPEVPEAMLLLHRGVYERMIREFNRGEAIPLTITTTVDVPANSGLGSSSALIVALVDAFRMFLRIPLGQYEIARLAFEIERLELALPGGRQDQYSAAFGGVNFIEFLPRDRVIVNPLRVSDAIRNEFESSLVVCFADSARDAATIIARQTAGVTQHDERTISAMDRLKAGAVEMKNSLLMGDIGKMAAVLGESWSSKKLTAAGISNDRVEQLFEVALSNGAMAGKVSGAGGGGFVFFIVPPEERLGLISALAAAGGQAGPVKLTDRGCEAWQIRNYRSRHRAMVEEGE
jgi:D-glycero-alpha-D-manno-heptose-7-phosphate kinase